MREFCCTSCGLFYWADRMEELLRYSYICPHCKDAENSSVYAVDTLGYFYFSEGNVAWANMKKWTSPKYCPNKETVDYYDKHGFEIRQ